MISDNNFALLLLVPWAALWVSGGIWLASVVFHLEPNEQLISGVAIGWIVQNWLSNLLSWFLPIPLAFWMAALTLFCVGMLTTLRSGWKSLFRIVIRPSQVALYTAIILIMFFISRGLAIFDDFQHLATISLIATGDFPPHFALDPQVVFGYHHFLQLFAAQFVRIGGLAPWVAVDVVRALSFGTAVMLGGLWTLRATRSQIAGWLAGAMVAFGSGTRWFLLFLPSDLVELIGKNLQLIGSGEGSGASLADALGNAWAVEGAGTIPFPFAFANGVFPPGVIQAFTANGLTFLAVVFLLLLTYNRIKDWLGLVLSAVLISTWGLLGESELVVFAAGSILVAGWYGLSKRTFHLPRSLWIWLGVSIAGCLIGILQGGAWADILLKYLGELLGESTAASYQTIGFQIALPAVVSSHLGILYLLQPALLLVALCEVGPVLLIFPLLFGMGRKAFNRERWLEVFFVAAALFSLTMLFVQFTGSTGVRNTPRLYVFIPLLCAFSVALVWKWTLTRSARIRSVVSAVALTVVAGGVFMFGIELVAIQRSVYSYYITALDARMARAYWNRLEQGALIFDPVPYRAPALFGRHTNAYLTWYQPKPEWLALKASPVPQELIASGFRYIYLDNNYWRDIGEQYQHLLSAECVQTIQEWDDQEGNFRRLLDIQTCQ